MAQRTSGTDSATRRSLSSVWIGLLGPLTIRRNGHHVEISGPKRRALLTLLSLHIDNPLGREQIIEALWPRRQTGREDSTLRVHISHLRDELETDREREPKVLLTRGQAYVLSGHVVDTDVRRFEELVRTARLRTEDDPGAAVELFDEALGLWRGRALQDVEYEEFAQDEIRRLDTLRLAAIRDRAGALIAVGEDIAAIQDLEPILRDDPTDEGAAGLLMRALYRVGRQSEALRVGSRLARHLREQGLEPSPRVALLEEQIVSHDPGLLPEGTLDPGEIKPGRSVRGYELRAEAGRGSIGVVYRAFQSAVGREVAIKVIDPDLARSPAFVRRFADEAKVIASLEHPHIVPLHDFWREPNGAFLVMRWMDGGSLGDRLGSRWEPGQLAGVFDQVASALGYAHSCGVVHRDVKPENILFDGRDNPYLCDFGLAAAGIETGSPRAGVARTVEPPYAAPELLRDEGPTVASDIFGLGVLLAEAATGESFDDGSGRQLSDPLWEVVATATASNPADRFPDMGAFRVALREAVGVQPPPAPKTVRRNPYKGLEPFEEIDSADFYGRDDVVERLLDVVASRGLVAVLGASGSGKSSVVRAGLIPQLRDGALPGSEGWSIVTMVPGDDPFEEFQLALRAAAVGSMEASSDLRSRELRERLLSALDGPNSSALLVVDQFEELFSSAVDEGTRERFLDNLADLASDPMKRFRVVLTMRADFSGRPLSHPTFGDMIAQSSLLLAPMRPDQLEEVIRRPAARVGVQVEPGLVSEIIRDVADAPAYLPLLQYVLAELFERRSEDRLTVQAYRSLGGVQGVVERRAEATFRSLDADAKSACRQLFLRMVYLGEHGEETRRRLPLSEVTGLGGRAAGERALEAFSSARLLTYDRDPVSRTPTVEVAHETVIERWTRYRIWIDEARSELLAQRRIATAAAAWEQSGEDPAYLLTGGPLTAANDVLESDRVDLNQIETRFVEESRAAARAAEEREAERRQHEANLEQRSRRRLGMGIGIAVVAVVVAALAVVAWNQRQRAGDIAALQERQNLGRELAAAAVVNLNSADPNLSLLLAIEGAESTLEADEAVLPEVTDALHRALINPRPELLAEGAGRASGGNILDYSPDGEALVVLAADGGAFVVDPDTGDEIGRVPAVEPRAFGVDFHPDGERILTTHSDGVREWDWRSGAMREILLPDGATATTAIYSKDGSQIAIGGADGVIRVFVTVSSRLSAQLEGHEGAAVTTLDFDNSGSRLVSASTNFSSGTGQQVLVHSIGTGEVTANIVLQFGWVVHAAWHPVPSTFWAPTGAFALTTGYGEMWLYNAAGERITSYGNGNHWSHAVAFDPTGTVMVAAGADGVARTYSTWIGGESLNTLPTGGLPLRDAAFNPAEPLDREVATVSADGKVRIWRHMLSSELPARIYHYVAPELIATPDGSRYGVVGKTYWYGMSDELTPTMELIDADSGETLMTRPVLEAIGLVSGRPALSPDGRLVSFTGPNGDIEIVDVEAGAMVELRDSGDRDWSQAFNSDGTFLATAGFDGSIVIWDTSTGELQRLLEGHGARVPINVTDPSQVGRVEGLAFRPGGTELASIGWDGTLRLWDPKQRTGRVLRSFDYELDSLAYSPDGSVLAVSERTGDVHLLDSDSGEEILTLDSVSGPPTDLVFSQDGELVAGAGPGHFVHLWETGEGRLVRRLRGSFYQPIDVAFVNDGKELLSLATQGVLRRYLLDPSDMVELARSEVSRDLTEEECLEYLQRACDA